MKKLKDKYKVEHIEAGHTPDGYDINERIQIQEKDKDNSIHLEIYRGGSAAYFIIGFEDTHDKEAYQDMGIDTDSKEFKRFEDGLKDNKNFNSKYVKDFLENAPELTVEKSQEINKQRFEDIQKQVAADKEYQANGGFLAEMNEQEKRESERFVGHEYKEQIAGRISNERLAEISEQAVINNPEASNQDLHAEIVAEINNDLDGLAEDPNWGESNIVLQKGSIAEVYSNSENKPVELTTLALSEIEKEAHSKALGENWEAVLGGDTTQIQANFDQKIADITKEQNFEKEYANRDYVDIEVEKSIKYEKFLETLHRDYNLSGDQAQAISMNHSDIEEFEKNLNSFQEEFSIDRKEAVNALTQFAVNDDQTKDIDQKVWDQNAMDNGYSEHEDRYEPEAREKQDLSKGTDIVSKEQEYSEQGKTEVAKPGRTYTGNVIEDSYDIKENKDKLYTKERDKSSSDHLKDGGVAVGLDASLAAATGGNYTAAMAASSIVTDKAQSLAFDKLDEKYKLSERAESLAKDSNLSKGGSEADKAENNWNTQTIKDEYGIESDYEAGLLAEGYKDREDFENELTSHQNEFSEHDIKREDAVKTLTQWAVDHDQTKDIDQKVWDQNAMDTGYRDPEDTYYPDLETSDHVQKKIDELSQEGKTEIAKPGRTYSGNVIEVGEDTTIQQTKSGKFIIHETENLPGIKEQDSNISAKIIYDAGGKGDIAAKSNDMAIGKEKEIEQKKSHEKAMER